MYTYKDSCNHVGPILVFTIGNSAVFAGAYDEALADITPWSLMVSCAGDGATYLPTSPVSFRSKAKAFLFPDTLAKVEVPPFLAIDWSDIVGAPLPRWWWEGLVAFLRENTGKVVFYCHGGHGRTGTALSILASLAGLVPEKKDPVRWVRKRYCVEAVESSTQIAYVEKITGRKVTVPASSLARIGHTVAGVVFDYGADVAGEQPSSEAAGAMPTKGPWFDWKGRRKPGGGW